MDQVQTLLTSLLELIPTSNDLQRYQRKLPAFPAFKLDVKNAALKLCLTGARNAVDYIFRITNDFISQIMSNRNQSVALFFLFGLVLFFLGGSSRSMIQQPSGGVVRGTTTIDMRNPVKIVPHAQEISIPVAYSYLTSTNDTDPLATVPVMAYLPRSGGNTIAQILGQCEGMVLGGVWTGGKSSTLEVVHEQGIKQVNADFSTKEGRETARNQGLKNIHNLVVLTQNLVDTAEIFADAAQAELWLWARHPVERQISLYYYKLSLKPGHPHYDANVFLYGLADWAQSALHFPNAMMYAILGQPQSPLGFSTADLILAKNVIRQKAKIGLLDQKAESIRRYLLGRPVGAAGGRECKEKLLHYAWKTKTHHQRVKPRSEEYEVLAQRNSWDMRLWEYVQYLFEVQGGSVLEADGGDEKVRDQE